jgi:pyruvate kinase
MKQDCILIATLPSLNNMEKVQRVFENPYVSEVRFNTGVQTPYSNQETLKMLKELSIKHNKKLWIDIKGRQLRVTKWADPLYSCIEISHRVQLLYPAQIYFRNGDKVAITHVKDGNKLFVDPLPRQALGAGQSVNIIAKDIDIEGYLTLTDKNYLIACKKLGLNYIMASFVEDLNDLAEIHQILPNAQIVSKIESLKGMSFILRYDIPNLMAARDDLYLQSGQNYSMLNHLKTIIQKDSNAICASKIFLSLEKRETVDFADFADLELMYNMGYRKFMLCDNVCNYCFLKAIQAWEEFINE